MKGTKDTQALMTGKLNSVFNEASYKVTLQSSWIEIVEIFEILCKLCIT